LGRLKQEEGDKELARQVFEEQEREGERRVPGGWRS